MPRRPLVVHRGPRCPQIALAGRRRTDAGTILCGMPRRPQLPQPLIRRYFPVQLAVKRGLIRRSQLRTSAWRRLFQGIYVDASVPDTHRLRCAAAAAYLLPETAAIAGRSAATLYGTGLCRADDPVEVLVPRSSPVPSVRGLRVHTGTLEPHEIRIVAEIPVTEPVRTCWDLALWVDLVEAVVIVDRMLASGRVSTAELADYAAARHGPRRRGARRFAKVLVLADGRAESPQESRLRVGLHLAGLPRPEVQYTIFGPDGFIARVDLAWPELKIAIEYDGLTHVGSARQMHNDRRRLNRLVAEGWIVLHVTAERLRDDFPRFVTEVKAARRSRLRG